MRFVCSTFGSAGDVFPLLGLALELRERGHDVVFATNPQFEEAIRRYGLEFEPLGTREDFHACIQNPDLWHPQKAFPHVLRSLQPALKQQYQVHARWAGDSNTIGISNCFGFGALLAQELHQLPVITVHLQPAVLWSRWEPPALPGLSGPRWMKRIQYWLAERLVIDPVVCPFLNAWRAEYGLPPVRRTMRWWNSPYGVLCLFSDWYAAPQPDWPGPLLQTDFPLWNDRSDQPLESDVESFLQAGDAPLVFTPGSANTHGQSFFESAVQACESLQRRGILLTEFAEQIPRSLPAGVVHFRYIPLDCLLPRSAAFVHHGGIGSTSQAMLAGIPQIVMPLAHDQFDNAARIRRLGIGGALPVKQFDGPNLAALLQRLLGSPAVGYACRTVAKRLQSRDGLSRTATAIEEHVERQRLGMREPVAR